MAYSTRHYARPYMGGNRIPSGVTMLLIANVAVFLVQWLTTGSVVDRFIFEAFALIPVKVVHGYLWQLVTYLFLHGGAMHILFNMLALWFFGKDLEGAWGMDRFLRFYFFCGVGAGLVVVAANYLFGKQDVATIGASGAIYGILLVCAMLWPDRIIIFYIFPIKLKYFVMIIGAISFLSLRNVNSGVSDVAHMSGMLFGYIFLKMPKVRGFDPLGAVEDKYRAWKLARAKRRFQVYLRKQQGPDRDRWTN